MFSKQIGKKSMTSQKQTKLVNLNLLWSGSIKTTTTKKDFSIRQDGWKILIFRVCITGVTQNAGSWSANEFLFKKDN